MDIRFWLLLSGVLMFFGAGFFFVSSARAAPNSKPAGATITVNTTADEDNTGSDCSLREAIVSSNGGTDFGGCGHSGSYGSGDVINFSLGCGVCQITLSNGNLYIDQDMTILGTGSANLTVSGNNASRVFNVNSDRIVTISDLTIANGSAINSAGVINNGAILTLNNVVITGNVAASGNGGGVYNNIGRMMVIVNSTILSNTANSGGGVYNAGLLTITNSSIGAVGLSNSASSGGGIFNDVGAALAVNNTTIVSNTTPSGNGGGIFNSGDAILASTSVLSNTSTGGGGIINSSTGVLTITLSNISNNINTGPTGGGGLENAFGVVTIVSSTISSNHSTHASGEGGGIENLNGTLIIVGSAVIRNTSSGVSSGGGGLRNSSFSSGTATMTISNSTISGNTALASGGGIENVQSASVSILNLYHSTIANNTSVTANGGGLSNASAMTNLKSTIVAGNTAGGSAPECLGAMTSQGYNLISNTASCGLVSTTGDVTDLDARLGPLANNGGATKTHALLPGSPAIDQIPVSTNGCGTTLTADQRGVIRPIGPKCDMGAYEAPINLFLPLILR